MQNMKGTKDQGGKWTAETLTVSYRLYSLFSRRHKGVVHFSILPFEYVGVKGEEAVEGVGAGLHKVAPGAAPHNGDELPVVPLYNCVAEHQLVFPLKKGIKKR